MTPEQQASTPEVGAEKPFISDAYEVIAKASQSHPETTESFLAVDTHVDALLQLAEDGEITGSAGVYTRDKLLLQFEDFLKELNTPVKDGEAPDPYGYIPGKDGLRASFRMLMDNPATSRNFKESLAMHIEAHKAKRAELLTAEKIEDMGEVEVAAAGGVEPMAEAKRAASGMIEVPDYIKNDSAAVPAVESAALAQSATPERAAEAPLAPEAETELQTNERFLRESKAELDELYVQHRAAAPGSDEQATLENQIKHAKEDVGTFARRVAKLKGNSVW